MIKQAIEQTHGGVMRLRLILDEAVALLEEVTSGDEARERTGKEMAKAWLGQVKAEPKAPVEQPEIAQSPSPGELIRAKKAQLLERFGGRLKQEFPPDGHVSEK